MGDVIDNGNLAFNRSDTFIFGAVVSGTGSLTQAGTGTTVLAGANSYSGTTSVIGKSALSLAIVAPTNGATNNANNLRYVNSTTLSVSNLQNGGINSSIGSSSNAAANLVIQGSTLRYTGAGASTDRLFTIGPVPAGMLATVYAESQWS